VTNGQGFALAQFPEPDMRFYMPQLMNPAGPLLPRRQLSLIDGAWSIWPMPSPRVPPSSTAARPTRAQRQHHLPQSQFVLTLSLRGRVNTSVYLGELARCCPVQADGWCQIAYEFELV